jgi:arsenate reductase (thioredoxin)
MERTKVKILFLCTGNAARSQMAEGLLRQMAPAFEVYSAGFKPRGLDEMAVDVMRETGIDISAQQSKGMKDLPTLKGFDYVITVSVTAEQECPIFPGKSKRLFWPFSDPQKAKGSEENKMNAYREVRDRVQERLDVFVREIAQAMPSNTTK